MRDVEFFFCYVFSGVWFCGGQNLPLASGSRGPVRVACACKNDFLLWTNADKRICCSLLGTVMVEAHQQHGRPPLGCPGQSREGVGNAKGVKKRKENY